MAKTALFIMHRTQPGKRGDVRLVWEKHLRPLIAGNLGHEAYFYCYDDSDPDTICVFQQYVDTAASQNFIKSTGYAAYLVEVSPLLAGAPEIRIATPQWIKVAE